MANMTTKNRMEAAKHSFMPAMEPISGREFAAQTMQNYHANLKMFKSAKAAEDFDTFIKDKYDDQIISESDNDDSKPEIVKKERQQAEKESKKRKPVKKWNKCVALQNTILFCFPHKMDQE